MKKYTTLVFTLSFLLMPFEVFGQINSGGSVGLGMANSYFDDGLSCQGWFERGIYHGIWLRGSIGYFSGNTKEDFLTAGDFNMFSMESSVLHKTALSKREKVYIGTGIGYYSLSNDLSSSEKNWAASHGVRISEEIENTFGFHVLAGIDLDIVRAFTLSLGAKYIILDSNARTRVTIISTDQSLSESARIDLNTLFLSIGLRRGF